MKFIQMGSAAWAPVSFAPSDSLFVVADPDAAGHGRRESDEPGVGEIVGGAGLAGDRERQLRGGDAGAVQHDLAQHRRHDAGGALADHVFHVGKIFFEHAAFVVGDARDVARRDAHAVVGKDAVGRGLLASSVISPAPSATGKIRRQLAR